MLEETTLHTVIKISVFAKCKACVESSSLLQGTQLRQVGGTWCFGLLKTNISKWYLLPGSTETK